jgi:predicted ester cyclase
MQPGSSPAHHANAIATFHDQALNRRNLAVIDGLFAPQIAFPPTPGLVATRDQVKANIAAQLTGIPDRQYQILDVIADNDLVAVRTRSVATHTAPVYSVPPTGRRFVEQEINFYRFTNGVVSEMRAFLDPLQAIMQLTAPPSQPVQLGFWSDPWPPREPAFRIPPHQAAAYARMVLGQIWRQKLALVDECFSPAFVMHGVPPGNPVDREAFKHNRARMWEAFPDLTETLEDIVSNGSRVAIISRAQGTHTGPFLSFPPTGRPINFATASIFELGQGPAPGTFVFTAVWSVSPIGELFKQIGAFGAPPPR